MRSSISNSNAFYRCFINAWHRAAEGGRGAQNARDFSQFAVAFCPAGGYNERNEDWGKMRRNEDWGKMRI